MVTKTNVPIQNIQAELNSLWGYKTKACLFNLIVYTHDPRRTDYFQDLTKMIMERFPCRIIFIKGNPTSKDSNLTINVSIEESQDKHKITCEQICIEASGPELVRVRFLLLTLLIPDLPIYLFWGQDPTTESTILPYLQCLATRLIFDSEATDNLQSFSKNMLERLKTSCIPVVDMNWARIGGWREVIAKTFDSMERFDQLAKANLITIIYNSQPNPLFFHPETQAIYMQGWLASRLSWDFIRAEKINQSHILHYQNKGVLHEVRLSPKADQKFPPEEILEMEVSGSENYSCHFVRKEADKVDVHASNQYQCELPFSLLMPTLRTGRSFMQEIFYQRVSDQYVPMLKLISLVNWS